MVKTISVVYVTVWGEAWPNAYYSVQSHGGDPHDIALKKAQNIWKVPKFPPPLLIEGVRDHPYITSAKGFLGWVWKNAIFADVQYCFNADIVGGWVKKSPKICWRNKGMVPNELVLLRWSLVVKLAIECMMKSTLNSMLVESVSA